MIRLVTREQPLGFEYPTHYGAFLVNSDCTRTAWTIDRDETYHIVLDGMEITKHDSICDDSLQFSPDGKHFAYVAEEGDRRFLVMMPSDPSRR